MLRKSTSMTLLLSGVLVLLTSVILYYEPEGRVAYWADWRLLGLTKEQWGGIHITTGFLFLIALLLHIYYNWKPILHYMRNQARQMVVMTGPMLVALVITGFVTVGTLLGWPPMQQVLELGDSFKDSHAETYGQPPYGHAELTAMDKFARQMGIDLAKAKAALTTEGLTFTDKDSLKEIAAANHVTPQHVYEVMKAGGGVALPAEPPSGLGKTSLAQICEQFSLDLPATIAGLRERGIQATPESTIKELATEAGVQPVDVYGMLREMNAAPEAHFADAAAPATTPDVTPASAEMDAAPTVAPAASGLPVEAPSGLGRLTLAELATAYGLDAERMVQYLTNQGFAATPQSSIRELAAAKGSDPHAVYDLLLAMPVQ